MKPEHDAGAAPIFLFTDFGLPAPYVGQMKAAIHRTAPAVQVVDLCQDLTPFQPRPAAYLLAALVPYLPVGASVVAVVDPGVGTERRGLVLKGSGIRLIGPDNGLLAITGHRLVDATWAALPDPESDACATFHGRDWFAPAATQLHTGQSQMLHDLGDIAPVGAPWPEDWAAVIYVDRYGNAMTGLRADRGMRQDQTLKIGGRTVRPARTFADVPVGEAFWYVNSIGLIEIAINQGNAAHQLGLEVGRPLFGG